MFYLKQYRASYLRIKILITNSRVMTQPRERVIAIDFFAYRLAAALVTSPYNTSNICMMKSKKNGGNFMHSTSYVLEQLG